jgi:hypothetical protein
MRSQTTVGTLTNNKRVGTDNKVKRSVAVRSAPPPRLGATSTSKVRKNVSATADPTRNSELKLTVSRMGNANTYKNNDALILPRLDGKKAGNSRVKKAW